MVSLLLLPNSYSSRLVNWNTQLIIFLKLVCTKIPFCTDQTKLSDIQHLHITPKHPNYLNPPLCIHHHFLNQLIFHILCQLVLFQEHQCLCYILTRTLLHILFFFPVNCGLLSKCVSEKPSSHFSIILHPANFF